MSTSHDFESRRRERRRRERLRKKRIRAAVILIALIGIIVLICVGISMCTNGGDENTPTDTVQLETTQQPSSVPTIAPSVKTSNIPPASERNNLLNIITESGQEKHCYLTFDDGPTENITSQILDTLRRYNVKATFFQIGSLIEAHPDMARRVYEEGHLIANHSSGHNYDKLYASKDSFMNEINKCYETIKNVTGEEEPFKLVRFPGGGYNSSADSYSPVKQQCKEAMKEQGFYYCDWNALNGDAEGKKKNAQELLEYLKRNLDGESNVVVLMHDAAAKQSTADALASIIEYFISEGYTFHRLDDVDFQAGVSATSPAETSMPTESSSTQTPSASPSASSTASPSSEPDSSTTAPSTSRPTAIPSTSGGTSIIIK